MEFIELRNITKSFEVGEVRLDVLKGVSLQIRRGEMVALMGTSGSGKTTLMNILGCLDRPTSGEYFLDGREVSRLSSDERAAIRNSTLGFVFQSYNLLPRTSALENVLMPLTYSGSGETPSAQRKRAVALLTRLGLADRLDHEPAKLSGGQQQRVAIARSLINQPKLIFADEPTGNLDSRATEEVLGLFRELNRNDGITLVLVTHEPDVAERADRVIRVRDGRVERNDEPEPAR